jgi:hypothetical protein
LISDKLVRQGGFGASLADCDNLANFGFAVVGIFIASWIVSPWSGRAPDAASPASYQSYVNWSAAIGAPDLLAARPVAAT